VVITGVVITADTVTSINASTTALNPPASATASAIGIATTGSYVRAMQTLTTGPTVQVTGRYVDDVSGAYAFTLPVTAPLVGPYAVAPNPLVLTADTAAAGKYSLGASLTGFAEKLSVLSTLTVGAIISTSFAFP
jgi:hypothetical protein